MKEERIVNGKLPSSSIVLCLALVSAAHAQTPSREDPAKYPSRLIRITVGFTAGGAVDVSGRVIAQRLSEQLGQSVIIDNRRSEEHTSELQSH